MKDILFSVINSVNSVDKLIKTNKIRRLLPV